MRKLNVLLLGLLTLTLGITTSCDKDEETDPVTEPDFAAPEVLFTQGDQTVDEGNEVVITGEVEAPAGILEIEFFKDDVPYGETITLDSDTVTAHAFTVTIPGNQVETTFSFEARATDQNEKTGSATATITVIEGPEITMEEYTSVTMYAQDTGNNMAFNAENGTSGTIGSMSADEIDLLLIFVGSYDDRKHGLYAPSDDFVSTMAAYGSWDWSGTHNATNIAISNESYADATPEDIASLSVSGTSAAVLQVDDVIAFETVDGYKGLIKITATALSKSDANITFDAKIVAPISSTTR